MYTHFDSRLGHAAGTRRLRNRQSLKLHVHDRQTLPVGQLRQQLIKVSPHIRSLHIRYRKHLEVFIQRLIEHFTSRPPPQQIDQLVTGNGVDPCRQRLRRIVGMALVMHSEQRFLDQVFNVIRHSGKPHPQKSTQMRTQRLQERVVGRGITAHPPHQQIPQCCFTFVHAAFTHVFVAGRNPVTGRGKNK